ncbi:antibiotic biosynthesis monooxygenase [Campylobacter lari]|nr:antibiotic biosynthesis monooxygenase [Campylobacter lari]MBT0819882.1 antibiotic biosynthesis monooxygenase [Campylobacter lari]
MIKGCISYVLNEEINGNKFIFIEEWENEELLQKHMEKQKNISKHYVI